ncbi:magnesium/cobalt efflux protein CorC [Weissella viridescens]|uniref:Magnesium/cobalt efflux protein CorC n=1 Tax=Weissella viridescens TaxID=1629 RepID=A0A380P8X6_WEIVI|nr:magnesium/cobalt efflux protein CorC [Weissella viridescens]
MIDRTEMEVVDINTTIKEAVQVYFKTKFSRLPVVADNDKDKVLGYIFNYDLMRQAYADDTVTVRKILRQMPTVPESMPIQDALQVMILSVHQWSLLRMSTVGHLELLPTKISTKSCLVQFVMK